MASLVNLEELLEEYGLSEEQIYNQMKRSIKTMRIALINENSQAGKNEMIYRSLKKVAEIKGYEVDNYGMYSAEDENSLTYVQNGILASILLNSGAADYVVTGCGTGEGAMLALNSFPRVDLLRSCV